MNDLIELLAPAGSKEALVAAVESGANAVYLAGKRFGARSFADNFTEAELEDAILFAHKRNARVFVAVNTVVDDTELEDLSRYFRFLYAAGADAAILQDLGAARLAKEAAPDLPLHASTQMTAHNAEGVRLLGALGFKRVVLSRELSMNDIKAIAENSGDIEIETFVHGALCVSYSGQCLMSGMIGGRSGNRGRCAQPCRLPYTLVDEDGRDVLAGADAGQYLLSPKDMNAADLLPEFIEAGVTSLKIEGRMKRPEYVAVVVDAYRRAIDAYFNKADAKMSPEDQKNLAQIFNRDFTTAYLKRRPGRRMMSDRRPNNRGVLAGRVLRYDARTKTAAIKLQEELSVGDAVEFWVKVGGRVAQTIDKMKRGEHWVDSAKPGDEISIQLRSPVRDNDRVFKVFDAKLMEKARGFFTGGAPVRRIPLDISATARIGRPLVIEAADADGFSGRAETTFICEAAQKRPLTDEMIRKQADRLGTSIFALRKFECELDDGVMAPISEINEARRKAVELVTQARLARFIRPPAKPFDEKTLTARLAAARPRTARRPELSVSADDVQKVRAALDGGADWIVFGGESYAGREILPRDYEEAYRLVKDARKKFMLATPRILQSRQISALKETLRAFRGRAIDAAAAQNISAVALLREWTGAPIHADVYMNAYNHLALLELAKLSVCSASLSPELNFTQIERIAALTDLAIECVAHGNLELMVSEYCAIGAYLGGLGDGACARPCKKRGYFLLDRKEERFPLAADQYCRMHVLNGKELSMLPHVARFKQIGIDRIRIEGKYMDAARLKALTAAYRRLLDADKNAPPIPEEALAKIEGGNITRGHYFRGVL